MIAHPHLVRAGTASAAKCLAAAFLLSAGALLRGPGRASLPGHLAALAFAQTTVCGWLGGPGPGPTAAGGPASHGALGGAVHLVPALITACVLGSAVTSRSLLAPALQERLRAFAHRLCALSCARIATVPAAPSGRRAGGRGGRDEVPRTEALVTGTGGRRGPPRAL